MSPQMKTALAKAERERKKRQRATEKPAQAARRKEMARIQAAARRARRRSADGAAPAGAGETGAVPRVEVHLAGLTYRWDRCPKRVVEAALKTSP